MLRLFFWCVETHFGGIETHVLSVETHFEGVETGSLCVYFTEEVRSNDRYVIAFDVLQAFIVLGKITRCLYNFALDSKCVGFQKMC